MLCLQHIMWGNQNLYGTVPFLLMSHLVESRDIVNPYD